MPVPDTHQKATSRFRERRHFRCRNPIDRDSFCSFRCTSIHSSCTETFCPRIQRTPCWTALSYKICASSCTPPLYCTISWWPLRCRRPCHHRRGGRPSVPGISPRNPCSTCTLFVCTMTSSMKNLCTRCGAGLLCKSVSSSCTLSFYCTSTACH